MNEIEFDIFEPHPMDLLSLTPLNTIGDIMRSVLTGEEYEEFIRYNKNYVLSPSYGKSEKDLFAQAVWPKSEERVMNWASVQHRLTYKGRGDL